MRVTSEQLIAKANELKELNDRFKTTISELEASENTLRGMWEGEANNAFHNAFESDKIQMTNFYNAVTIYVYKLLEIAQRYARIEATNVSISSTRTYH